MIASAIGEQRGPRDSQHDISAAHYIPPHRPRRELAVASIGALGVVYGDIGTSPLYAMKECLAWPTLAARDRHADARANVLGVLSLMFWALILVICIKYLVFVLRADNKGEGGILALAALVEGTSRDAARAQARHPDPARPVRRRAAVRRRRDHARDLGARRDGGSLRAEPGARPPGRADHGRRSWSGCSWSSATAPARIGVAFGPVMLVWFVAIGAIGAALDRRATRTCSRRVNPVLRRRVPRHATATTASSCSASVFLVVTGGEALYADMGHFGSDPIRIAWFTDRAARPAAQLLRPGRAVARPRRWARSRTRSTRWPRARC